VKDSAAIAAEARIRRALEEPISLSATEMPFQEVVARLQADSRIGIQLDTRAITDAGGAADMPISAAISNTRLRSALYLLLHSHDLDWIIDADSLIITTSASAKERLETRIYPVRDLLDRVEGVDDYDSVIDAVTSTISPTTWTDAGGSGSISPFPNARSLIVTQTREVHEVMEILFAKLREARERQGIVSSSDSGGRSSANSDDYSTSRSYEEEDDRPPPRRIHVSTTQPPWRMPQAYR
jgi:hypothetical protein